MSSRADAKLRQNIEQQLERLLQQYQDLQDEQSSMDKAEYDQMLEETLEQLSQMKENLNKMTSGNVTLVSEFTSMQLAIQAAVSRAFQTPDVIRMFANKNSGQLRQRLANLQRDQKLGQVSEQSLQQQSLEILSALKKLNEKLSPEEEAFLASHKTAAMAAFEAAASDDMGSNTQATLLKTASVSVKNAKS